MSQEEGDLPSATPLDLLINAIAGSTDYVYPPPYPDTSPREEENSAVLPQIGVEGTSKENQSRTGQVPSNRNRRSRQNGSPTPRQKAISKVLSEQIIRSSTTSSSSLHHAEEDTTSTKIEVWHPTAGQKSYGKERRIIAPPPKLCISGALLPTISSVSLSTTSASASISSSQTHLIAPSLKTLPEVPSQSPARGKKGEKSDHQRKLIYAARNAGFGATLPKSRGNVEGKDRESLLGDGLNFPGLWIGEDVGKNKEFHLELKVNAQDQSPSSAIIQDNEDCPISTSIDSNEGFSEKNRVEVLKEQRQEVGGPSQDIPIDDSTSLSEVLDSSSMADLQPLAEAVKQVNEAAKQTLAEHLPEIHLTTDQSNIENDTRPVNTSNITPTTDINATIGHAGKGTPTPVQATPPYLTFLSTPLRLVSKPSQKTAKARSMASCFSSNSPFALWTRIHGQTVRTKYMKLEYDPSSSSPSGSGQGKLTSKTGKWTPFRFEISRRAVPPMIEKKSKIPNQPPMQMEGDEGNEDIMTYGSIVRLVDLQSGIKSDIVKIVKVESGEHRLNENTDGHPISELQRIGLVRLNSDLSDYKSENGERYYLSAPGARLGGGELIDGRSGRAKPASNKNKKRPFSADVPVEGSDPNPDTLDSMERPIQDTTVEGEFAESEPPKKKKTKRNALAAAVLAEDEDGGLQTVLSWFKARREEQPVPVSSSGGATVMLEKVEDWMSWIIGGVACSSQTIYKTMIPSSDDSIPRPMSESINPIPEILVPPFYDPSQQKLDLTLSQFHFPSTSGGVPRGADKPLEIYLGPIGPLFATCWRSTSHKNTPTAAIPYFPEQGGDEEEKVISAWPADKRHVIVRVYLPDREEIEEVIKELERKINHLNGEKVHHEEKTQDDVAGINQIQEGQPQDPAGNDGLQYNVKDAPDLGNTNTTNTSTTWYDPASELSDPHPHPRHDHEDLSIVAALEMSGSLNDLAAFDENVSQAQPEPQTQTVVAQADGGIVIDPTLEPSQAQPVPLLDIAQTSSQQDTIRLHLPANQDGDGRTASNSIVLTLPLIMVRPSDGVGFGIGKSIAIVGGEEMDKEQGNLRIIDN
ncbi:hypothetical protein I302_105774 [Kwoniella bestiolae CBS 10118]|uniref:Uncharacterized protein n=1 Tax=Kwoniella bestiolae CBS 10118 TaxID=1296100 RepID=A0A1B9G233_9TREE|nr:hypothetical protein I302_04896 [Kwoniella bestiolae CBS 10118]OCF25086.1 hypothetical protein I302_04896 [Kwoniella bestiolae CBS 10118]